jgi:hypothetical protein
MAIAYHRDQAGAPALVYNTLANNIAHFTSLKTILKGCLVSGYGAHPAAGWWLIAEGDSHLVLRNGTQTGYVGLSFSAGVVTVHVSETFTGVTGGILQGDGQKSGTAAGNTVPQRLGIKWVASASTASTWMVVADERTFSLTCITNVDGTPWVPVLGAAGSANFMLHAGEDSAGNFIALGGTNTTAGAVDSQIDGFSAEGFTSLRNPSTGLLVGGTSLAVSTPGLTTTLRVDSAALMLPEVDIVRPCWLGAGAWAGYLRGLVMPGMLGVYLPGMVANSLGFVGQYNSRTANTPLSLGGTWAYFVPVYHPRSTALLMTDDPEYW